MNNVLPFNPHKRKVTASRPRRTKENEVEKMALKAIRTLLSDRTEIIMFGAQIAYHTLDYINADTVLADTLITEIRSGQCSLEEASLMARSLAKDLCTMLT